MLWTVYPSAFTTKGQQEDLTWSEWLDLLSQHDQRSSKDGPCFVPGRVEGPRAKANVQAITAMVLDLEHLAPDQMAELLLQLSRWEYLYYSTWRSNPVEPRGRVILPLANELLPAQFPQAWQALNATIGQVNDPTSKDIVHLYYMPSCPEDHTPEIIHNAGVLLDPNTLQAATSHTPAVVKREPIARPAVARAVKALARKAQPARQEQWNQILEGHKFADKGARNDTLLYLTMDLARALPANDPADLAVIFIESLTAMEAIQGAPTLEQVVSMISRGQDKLAEQEAEKQRKRLSALRFKIMTARSNGGTDPYSPEEITALAKTQSCEPEELLQRWIVYQGGAYYFLTLDGYQGPFTTDGQALADTYLSPTGLKVLEYVGKDDKPRLKQLPEILRLYGTPANRTVADVTIQSSYYNAITKTLHEATARRDKTLQAVQHTDVQAWLDVLGNQHADKLLDWIAVCPQLELTCCGLYLFGPSGTGKTLLAHGLSQLWGDGIPTDISEAFSAFNERLARCPLILADEYIPQKYGESVTGQIRQLIGTSSFTIRRKHKATAELHGCTRVIFTSNEAVLFELDDSVGRLSQEALAKRILYLPTGPQAAELLTRIKPARLQQWRGRAIAEHALWLAENREVTRGQRLHVEGDLGTMLRRLNIGNRATSLVCEWLVGYLLNPRKVEDQEQALIRLDLGRLYVNNQALVKYWKLYHEHEQNLSTHKIGKALGALSKSERASNLTVDIPGRGRTRLRYWEIDTDNLIEWSEANNWASCEELEERLHQRNDGTTPEEEPF